MLRKFAKFRTNILQVLLTRGGFDESRHCRKTDREEPWSPSHKYLQKINRGPSQPVPSSRFMRRPQAERDSKAFRVPIHVGKCLQCFGNFFKAAALGLLLRLEKEQGRCQEVLCDGLSSISMSSWQNAVQEDAIDRPRAFRDIQPGHEIRVLLLWAF